MKVQVFEVLFDDAAQNPQAVYRSGQEVAFRVHVKLAQPVKCRAIYVTLLGNSLVHWTESHSSGSGKSRRTRTVHYRSEEIYIDQKVAIFTPQTDGPLAEHHPAGEYFYTVTFQIPATAPSSFEGGVGKIRYLVKANIDRPWRWDTFIQRLYTVIRDFDLNLQPQALTGPYSASDDFDVNCCYCFNCCYGRVRVRIALAKRGFVPGEQIHVTGELLNTSATDLLSVGLEIYQRIQFHATSKTKTINRVVSAVQLPSIEKGQSGQINHRLLVNALPSSRIEGCGNIEVQYYFRLNADGGCCLSVQKECCELLIGTIPLVSAFDFVSGAPPPGYTPAPPTYEECMFGRQDVENPQPQESPGNARPHQGDWQRQWAPSYPVFPSLTPVG